MTGTGTQTRTTGVTTIALLVLRTGELKIYPYHNKINRVFTEDNFVFTFVPKHTLCVCQNSKKAGNANIFLSFLPLTLCMLRNFACFFVVCGFVF